MSDMAFVNGTVKVHMEFVTADGSHADASNIKLNIYDLNGVLIESVDITDEDRISTGVYEKEYTVPAGYTNVIAQVVGNIGSATIVGNAEIDTQSADSINPNDYLNDVKTALQIPLSDTSKDAYLTTVIPYIIQFIQEYCKTDFKNSAGQIELPLGLKLAVAKMAQYNMKDVSIDSESIAGLALKVADGYPKSIMTMLDSYKVRKISFM